MRSSDRGWRGRAVVLTNRRRGRLSPGVIRSRDGSRCVNIVFIWNVFRGASVVVGDEFADLVSRNI